jgi:hypothetical protein
MTPKFPYTSLLPLALILGLLLAAAGLAVAGGATLRRRLK